MSDPILLEINDGIALVTLNRPDKHNALNYALIDRLMAVLDAIETDAAVRAVILTGAGERAFSAGADIHEFSESVRRGRDAAVRDFVRRGQAMTARLEAFKKPVIAAVNGLAFGGGCEITEAVHLAIASETRAFRQTGNQSRHAADLRRNAAAAAARRAQARAGVAADRRYLHAGAGAGDRAGQHGRAARRRCCRRRANWPAASSGTRRWRSAAIITAVTRGLNMTIGEGLQVESEQFAAMVPTGDLGEGIHAWIERRQPVYRGR